MVLALAASSALAIPLPGTLDQHQEVITGNGATWSDASMGVAGWRLGQTFTAGVSGKLDAVGVYVSATQPLPPPAVQVQPHPAVGNAVIQIRSTDLSGLPGSLLATESPTLSASPGWEYFVLPSPINIVIGTKYAIVMWTTDPTILNWAGDCSNSYPGGKAVVYDSFSFAWFPISGSPAYCQQDFAFQTYVTAAPPAATAPPATAPPTSTTPAKDAPNGGPAIPVIVAGLVAAAAAAFVTMRRYGLARR
jgi:hypothetical protein